MQTQDFYDLVEDITNNKRIRWITVKGRHIPLKKGQNVEFDEKGNYSIVSEKNRKKSGNNIKDRNALRERIRYLRNKLQDESLKKPDRKKINDEIVKLRKMLKGLMFNRDFLVEDYPVEQYERTSPKGTKHEVKAHTRGEGKKEEKITSVNQLRRKTSEEIEQEKKQLEDPNYIIEQNIKEIISYLKKDLQNKILEGRTRLQKQIRNLEDILKVRNKEIKKEMLIQEFESLLQFYSLEKKEYGESEGYGLIKNFLDTKLKQKEWLDPDVLEAFEKELEEAKKPSFTNLGLKKTIPKRDMKRRDSMDKLIQWVLHKAKLTTDPEEAKQIAFAISNSNKKTKNKEKVEAQKSTIQEVGESYNKSQEKEWESTWSEIGESFTKQRLARKTSKADLITEDATRLQQYASKIAMIEKARQTPEAKALLEAFGKEAFKTEIESITIPFTTMNTETGAVVQGSVVEGLQENTKQMTPVSSSTVRSVGQFDSELLVQFHPSKTTPQRTYRYQFETSDHAEEAYRSLTESGSPGRWIWQNIRGHTKGEPITPSKLGPAILTGNPTIGGTTASLEEYTLSNRTPVQRTKGFEQQVKQLKRETSNPTTDPNTGSRIEALLGVRKILREGLPEGIPLQKNDFPTVFTADFTMDGFITRSGKFDYRPEGQGIKFKDYDNLKEEFKKVSHLPVFGKRTIGSHKEASNSLIGFAHNWQYIDPGIVDDQGHIKADVEMFYDIHDLSGLDDPNELPVSIGFDDLGDGTIQNISGLHHLAVSLDKLETDRCSSLGGTPCNISVKRKITDFIKSKFTKKGVDSDSNDLLNNRTESFYDNIQKESCPPIKNKKNKSESMGLINKKITEDATKAKPEDKEVSDEELEDEEETEETPKKGKKDMVLENLTKELADLKTVNAELKASSIKTTTDLQNFVKKMEDNMKKQEDLQKISDDKEAINLKVLLQKEPYELPEVTVKDMTLNQLKDQKKIFDSMKRVRDFYESSSKEDRIPEVNKELFDMTPAGTSFNMLGRVLKASQDKFQANFPSAKEVQN